MNRAELKKIAKQRIRGKIGVLFLISLVVFAISLVAEIASRYIPYVGLLLYVICVAPAISLGMTRIYLKVADGKDVRVGEIFDGFNDFWSAFKVQFFSALFTLLWSLLLIIPGIVKALSYSMAMNILAENRGMPALEAIRKSEQMMKGHKEELFVFSSSFILWCVLYILTLYIAGIWVIPYISTAHALFYYYVKNKLEANYAEQETPVQAIEEPANEEGPVQEPEQGISSKETDAD